ncbi:MAG: deoxyribodipyrimidine photo-lyase [Flavipsychrobacter sp.]
MRQKVAIFWFRRDLRLEDNTGLYHALQSGYPVVPIFIFDKAILDELEDTKDKRVTFIYNELQKIQTELINIGSTLNVFHDNVMSSYETLINKYEIAEVYTNEDYEPYAIKRDNEVENFLTSNNIAFKKFKDQVIFHKDEIIKDNGEPYVVYTPYSKKWKTVLNKSYLTTYSIEKLSGNFYQQKTISLPELSSIGFEHIDFISPSCEVNELIIKHYDETRDIPSINGTTKLSVHLRFGTISIRKLVHDAMQLNEKYLNELIWRDFYHMILWYYPNNVSESFRKEYDEIQWRNNEQEFEAWCNGQTGYPIVDAGMRELNETGYMHNRVRMVVASFLTKHLLIDWRWGEAYFAAKLLDYDLAANNGGWQWAAGCGCDAAPYFRIFNPYLQTKKFDPNLKYIRQWVPELEELNYPQPIVEHEFARKRCLETYKVALDKGK